MTAMTPVWPHPYVTARSTSERELLSEVAPNRLVFVFGSNLAGRHTGGNAHHAAQYFDAEPGKGYGWFGRSYAVPVMDVALRTLPRHHIVGHVERFLAAAAAEPDFTFYVVALGPGLAGIPHDVMAPMFASAPENVLLPPEWLSRLRAPQKETPIKDGAIA